VTDVSITHIGGPTALIQPEPDEGSRVGWPDPGDPANMLDRD
jgi:hypothetical protein